MRGDQPVYAALGLRPGATRAEVDDAYRRLIKIHHPDRNGGDGGRAAEINRAYTILRHQLPSAGARRTVPVPVYARRRASGGRRTAWSLILLAAAGSAILIALNGFEDWNGQSRAPVRWSGSESPVSIAAIPSLGSFDDPLHGSIIEAAIGHALDFHALGDDSGAVAYSRDCHSRLRSEPNLVLFDACAAFDESTVTLAGAGAAMDSGPFSGTTVMSRAMASARALSDDSLGADSRLQQIRSRVELALLPRLDAAAGRDTP